MRTARSTSFFRLLLVCSSLTGGSFAVSSSSAAKTEREQCAAEYATGGGGGAGEECTGDGGTAAFGGYYDGDGDRDGSSSAARRRRLSREEEDNDGDAGSISSGGSSGRRLPNFSDEPECELFLAESTLPNAGLGVFTGVAREKGEPIAHPDICIPFIDMYYHNGDDFFPNPFKHYFWVGAEMGMASENDNEDNEAYCPGLDSDANSYPALLNVAKVTPKYDEAGLHRSRDPGAGARSPYVNGTTYVSRSMVAGAEVFKDYGQNWFDHRYDIFGDLPMSDDFPEATDLVEDMMDLVAVEDNEEMMADLYEVVKSFKPLHPSQRVPRNKRLHSFRSRILNALPDKFEDAKRAIDEHDGDFTALMEATATRSLDFLKRHGKCLDNIRGGRSTVPGAGLGAFATRDLPAGTVVTASTLIHIPDKKFANMYEFVEDDFERTGEHRVNTDKVVGKQLMLNYCFGHPDSTLLLCPYGNNINYINHNRQEANLKIRWATNFPSGHNQTAVEKGPFDMFSKTEQPFLAFDYVATKNIAKDTELFLDYGDAWVAAWEGHVANWKPPPGAEHYASGRYMNEHFGDSVLRTEEEQVDDPYPANLELRCHQELLEHQDVTYLDIKWTLEDYGVHCEITGRERRKNKFYYTVKMETSGRSAQRQRKNVPREAIAFFDVPYSSDISLPNAFRHEIGIPDDLVPDQWKNLKNSQGKKR